MLLNFGSLHFMLIFEYTFDYGAFVSPLSFRATY